MLFCSPIQASIASQSSLSRTNSHSGKPVRSRRSRFNICRAAELICTILCFGSTAITPSFKPDNTAEISSRLLVNATIRSSAPCAKLFKAAPNSPISSRRNRAKRRPSSPSAIRVAIPVISIIGRVKILVRKKPKIKNNPVMTNTLTKI